MASLILVIVVTLIGGQWVGYAVVLGSCVACAYYLAQAAAQLRCRHGRRAHPVRRVPAGRDRDRRARRAPCRRARGRGRRAPAHGPPAAPDGVALTRAHCGRRLRGRADGGSRGARRERRPRRDAGRRRRVDRARRDPGLHDRGAGGLAAVPGSRAHADRRRHAGGHADLPRRGRAREALPGHADVDDADCIGAAAGGRAGARRARLPVRAGPPLHGRRARVRDRARRALRARARTCPPVRRRATIARGPGHARVDRRAPRALAGAGRGAAHARRARRPGDRRPVRRRSRAGRPHRAPCARARGSRAAGGRAHPRAVRTRHRERHAGRRRDPPRRDAARSRHAGSAGQRVPQRGPPARPSAASSSARC